MEQKKKSSLARLFEYVGNYRYLTMLAVTLSAISAWIALVPFYYIWRIVKEVLEVALDCQGESGRESPSHGHF